ncbi:hypothetical protein L873DRAFT_1791268 [Choiromyces venosus 120613-1]|uniref:Uncharacterized protein n=1 Tax=Choiromyces venosus 120613-1 TaxID=1336337 RepID=A0A3N4JFF6_9PEZI|nr:hypothetical protein L873DRAFT_1791268 [Choiromyces venosus 120613-1]
MKDSKAVGRAQKLEFEEGFDCLNDLCDVATPEVEVLSSYPIPEALGSCVKGNTFKSRKTSCHQTSLMDSCIVEDHWMERSNKWEPRHAHLIVLLVLCGNLRFLTLEKRRRVGEDRKEQVFLLG